MATDSERRRALKAERSVQRRRMTLIQRDANREVTRLLRRARNNIAARLAATPTEFEAFQLPLLMRAIGRELEEVARGGAAALRRGATSSFAAGIEAVDAPLEAGIALARPGFRLSGLIPEVDSRPLFALRDGLVARIEGISLAAVDKINSELALVAIGAESRTQATANIARHLKGSGARALTVIRTELGRAYSIAGQERFEQASTVLPGLKKEWRRSGKIHSRPEHDAANGQIVGVDESFLVGGESLRFPRDPKASAANTVNCGCTSLPFMESWEVSAGARAAA